MKEIEKFKNLINQEKYFEAHEALEEIWFPIRKRKNDCCLVLKGFINGAVSLELHKRDKVKQSQNVYNTYLKHTSEQKIEATNNKIKFKNLKSFMDKKLADSFKS